VRLAAGALLLSCTALAQAQYMWVDAKGLKQVSDRPPPPTVPYKDILKAPIGQYSAKNMPPAKAGAAVPSPLPTSETAVTTPASAPAPAPGAASKARATVAEREADYIKRQKEKTDKDKKEAEEKATRTAQAEQCLRVAANKAALDKGIRLSNLDKNGEPVVMDEAQRAAESKKASEALAGCKTI
jgi:type IV secretory pathway VirB10-like protein